MNIDSALLQPYVAKYIWWKSASEALAQPQQIIAQVMNIGDFADMQMLARAVGDEVLKQVLIHAQPGWFNERSWAYWHYRLGLAQVDQVPPMPKRYLP